MSERQVRIGDEVTEFTTERAGDRLQLRTEGGQEVAIEILAIGDEEAELMIAGQRALVPFVRRGTTLLFHFGGEAFTAEVLPRRSGKARHGEPSMTAPMPGVVLKIFVREGEFVEKGAPLLVLEAMKMEHQITAPWAGTVERLQCTEGELVQPGVELIRVTREETAE